MLQCRELFIVTFPGYTSNDNQVIEFCFRLSQGCIVNLQGVRRLGAAAVDCCHVALGIVDSYWEFRLKPWDMAAGVLVYLTLLILCALHFGILE